MNDYKILQVSELKSFPMRDLRQDVLDKLEERIKNHSYNDARPLSIVELNNEYIVADGNHRLDVLQRKNIKEVPCVIYRDVDIYKIAIKANQDEDVYAPLDLFDWLNIIRKLREDYTLPQIAKKIGWSESKLFQYSALISNILTNVLDLCKLHQEGRVTEEVTSVSFNFTERWFRRPRRVEQERSFELFNVG